MSSLTTLASACGGPCPRYQVWPVRTSWTAASTAPARVEMYEAAAVAKGSACRGGAGAGEAALSGRDGAEGPPATGPFPPPRAAMLTIMTAAVIRQAPRTASTARVRACGARTECLPPAACG